MATAELRARATLDGSQFTSAMGSIQGKMMGAVAGGNLLSQAIQKLAGGLRDSIKEAIGFGDQISDTARALNMSSDNLLQFDRAGKLSGQTTEGMSQRFFKLADSQQEAILGNQQLKESFARLGVSMKDLTTMDPGALMQAMAIGAERSATATKNLNDILGRGAASQMQEVFEKMRAGEGASPITKADIMALDNANAALVKFSTGWGEFKTKIGAGVATLFGFGASAKDMEQADAKQRAMAAKQQEELRIVAQEKRTAARGELTAKIAAEQGKLETADYSGIRVSASTAADTMARIGAFTGGQADSSKQILERQMAVMKEQLSVAQRNEDNLARIAEYTASLKLLEE
jgi:hypothetical protein